MNEQAKEAVIEIIKSQALFLSSAHIRYEYDVAQSLHIIDIEADNLNFLDQEDWQNIKYKLVDEFEEKFIDEALLFVNNNSLIRANVDNLTFELRPKEVVKVFESPYWSTWENITTSEFYSLYAFNKAVPNVTKKKKRKRNFVSFPLIHYKGVEQNIKSVLTSVRTDLLFYGN